MIGSNGSLKTNFILKMVEQLGFNCTKKQATNCFDSILRKYKEVKDTLNTTGFGIDPEKDKSIEEGKFLHCLNLIFYSHFSEIPR